MVVKTINLITKETKSKNIGLSKEDWK